MSETRDDATNSPSGEDGGSSEDTYTVAEAARVLGIGDRRVQQLVGAGEILGERHGNRWKLSAWSVHDYLKAHGPGRPRVSRLDRSPDERGSLESVREWMDKVNILERELGRLEGRLELTEQTESTIREERDRLLRERDEERRRADELQRRLEEERERWLTGSEGSSSAPRIAEDTSVGDSEGSRPGEDTGEPETGVGRRSWWRRVFGN